MNSQLQQQIIEAALFAAERPLSLERLQQLFAEAQRPDKATLRQQIIALQQACEDRGIELVEVASGFRYQTRPALGGYLAGLWEERTPRFSRALLETLVLIAYRQPVTRAEIESIRGVVVSSQIIKTLQERQWVRVIGHRDVPGRPALYATTREFLDYFNLASLDALPPLAELKDLDMFNRQLDLRLPGEEAAADGAAMVSALDARQGKHHRSEELA
ncbi:MAG: SMC-Scp complex subunit ScpB [Gammaproteobacteria bacterium]|nr:SMC-Scp complex subunit ScpB [Gammaproteobacteria bacterium]